MFGRKKKKKAVVVEKTPIQKIAEEIKTNTNAVTTLERLKPRLNKLHAWAYLIVFCTYICFN